MADSIAATVQTPAVSATAGYSVARGGNLNISAQWDEGDALVADANLAFGTFAAPPVPGNPYVAAAKGDKYPLVEFLERVNISVTLGWIRASGSAFVPNAHGVVLAENLYAVLTDGDADSETILAVAGPFAAVA